MTETPLFDGYEPPERPNVEVLSAGQRLTLRQAENASRGVHPLTRGRLHPEASRDAARSDKRNLPFTCGSCVHREARVGAHGYPKCLLPGPDGKPLAARLTHSAATDCRGWWPACPQYQPMEETMTEPEVIERQRRDGDERHGTPTGAVRHSRRGELPCDACRAAKAEYDQRYRSAPEKTRKNRQNAKAQYLAARDLRRAHEDEYRALYLRHKAQLVAEETT